MFILILNLCSIQVVRRFETCVRYGPVMVQQDPPALPCGRPSAKDLPQAPHGVDTLFGEIASRALVGRLQTQKNVPLVTVMKKLEACYRATCVACSRFIPIGTFYP